jgi:tRNA U54 and U55 pseudouridine synthase Pus10
MKKLVNSHGEKYGEFSTIKEATDEYNKLSKTTPHMKSYNLIVEADTKIGGYKIIKDLKEELNQYSDLGMGL